MKKIKKGYYTNLCIPTKGLLFCVLMLAALHSDLLSQNKAYYCDPESGSMSNPGTLVAPWSSLKSVLQAGKKFQDGDTIYLMSGQHGFPSVKTKNTGDVTIIALEGEDPVIERISFTGASHWVLKNLTISTNGKRVPTNPPLEHPVYPIINNSIVQISGSSSYITLDNCSINSIDNSASWTKDDWNYKAWSGIYHKETENITVRNCYIKNVNFGIHNGGGTSVKNTLYEYNTVDRFNGDGLRGHGVNTVIQYNNVINAIETNGNHIDMIQIVGGSTGLILRGNKFISQVDPDIPFITSAQGIAFFDGWFYDYVIENNVVITNHWHGITLLGAKNCKIINNTVIDPDGNDLWIQIAALKGGSPSSGNIVRNNICTAMKNDANIGEVDNNIIVLASEINDYFTDFAALDLSLKYGSRAINAGSSDGAPDKDILGTQRPQDGKYDVGAYEFKAITDNVTGVSLSANDISIAVDETYDLNANIEPENASIKDVIWSSDNENVAFVVDGTVTARTKGKATITVATVEGNFKDKCTVNVIAPKGDYNLALFKPVTVDAEESNYPGAALVDGEITSNSRWMAETMPQSAVIDLGDDFNITGFEVYTFKDRAYQYTIEVKSEKGEYVVIVDRTSSKENTQPITDDVATVGRYVKITVTGAADYTGSFISLHELKVYGNESEIAPVIPVSSISLSPANKTVNIGDTFALTADISPSNATNKGVEYSSDNTSIATVNSSGQVSAVSNGTAKITATTIDGGYSAFCSVTVPESKIAVTGISVDKSSVTLQEGETIDLNETITPADATNKSITWSSSNETVATVDANGVVSALSGGQAIITVTTNDGGFTATCTVEVPETIIPVTGITVTPDSISIHVGETAVLTEIIAPEDASNKSVTWASNDEGIATVDENGMVTAIGQGNTSIIVSTTHGEFKATVQVEVLSKTDQIVQDKNDFVIFPNPVLSNSNLSIQSGFLTGKIVSIIDTNGKMVYSKKANHNKLIIPVSEYMQSGVYFVRIKGDNMTSIRKIIIR